VCDENDFSSDFPFDEELSTFNERLEKAAHCMKDKENTRILN